MSNSKVSLESVVHQNKALKEDYDKLSKEAAKLKATNENLERNLHAKSELLKTVEEQQRSIVKKMKDENKQELLDTQKLVGIEKMMYEDLRSHCMLKYEEF